MFKVVVICGVKPSQTDNYLKKHDFYYNGIDRIDNTKGYLSDNCVSCCSHCNTAKMQMTYEDFRKWVTAVYERISTHSLFPVKQPYVSTHKFASIKSTACRP